jgi:ribulose-bisphosphate carboxylase large chain
LGDATRIEADYLIETAFDPRVAALAIAGEQSSGTFAPVPGETPELKARAAARVERLVEIETVAAAALPGARHPPNGAPLIRRAALTLSWPLDNLGPSLPNLLATVAGNLFELGQLSGLKLLDLRLPEAFSQASPGVRFGIAGTRALASVAQRPLIGTIIKPSVGFGPEETASLTATLCAAGIDFIKDDELQADGPSCPFEARVTAVMRVIKTDADRSGKQVMYAFNLTGEVDEMRRRHDFVRAAGGTCVMASLNAVGLSGFMALARHAALPIHAHRNGWGAISRHPLLGWSFIAWQKIWRLAGADHMHVNGLRNKFSEDDASVIAAARACLTPLSAKTPHLAMPVFSSGQTVHQVAATYAALGSTDLIYAAGGGIMAHPGGPASGVAALRAAWDAAVAGVPAAEQALSHPALAQALAVP